MAKKKLKYDRTYIGNSIMWLIFDYPRVSSATKWKIKKIAYRLKLYKPTDIVEIECLNNAINRER